MSTMSEDLARLEKLRALMPQFRIELCKPDMDETLCVAVIKDGMFCKHVFQRELLDNLDENVQKYIVANFETVMKKLRK